MHNLSGSALEEETDAEFRERLSKMESIVNRRFAPLERGEHITVGELKNRLRELSNAGWYVKPYSKMNQRELWSYWTQLKKEVRVALIRPPYWDR